jgi:hypothetical protein
LQKLTALPETTDELCTVARKLGVPESELWLGDRATERNIKEMSEQGRGPCFFAASSAAFSGARPAARPARRSSIGAIGCACRHRPTRTGAADRLAAARSIAQAIAADANAGARI